MLFTFDCYGTIIDWTNGAKKKFLELYPNKERESDEFIKLWGERDWELVSKGVYKPYREILREGFTYALEKLELKYDDNIIEELVLSIYEWIPFPETPHILMNLRKRGVKLGIISNTDRDFILKSVENIGVRFDYIIVAEDIKVYKPSRKVFEEAKKLIPIHEQYKWYHVSSYPRYDINPASQVGIKTIFIDRYNLMDQLNVEPDYILSRFEDLVKIVEKEKI